MTPLSTSPPKSRQEREINSLPHELVKMGALFFSKHTKGHFFLKEKSWITSELCCCVLYINEEANDNFSVQEIKGAPSPNRQTAPTSHSAMVRGMLESAIWEKK